MNEKIDEWGQHCGTVVNLLLAVSASHREVLVQNQAALLLTLSLLMHTGNSRRCPNASGPCYPHRKLGWS